MEKGGGVRTNLTSSSALQYILYSYLYKMKYWEILLLAQEKRGNSGLTIPFIIGSQEFLENNLNQDIEQLVIDIITNSSFEICLRYCMNIQTFILEKRRPKNNVIYLTYNLEEQVKLSLSNFSKDDFGKDIIDTITILKNMFQDTILIRKYSAETNVYRIPSWTYFTKDDKEFILQSFEDLNSL